MQLLPVRQQPTFEYEARDDAGELVRGMIDADTRDAAGRLLSSRGLFVVRIADGSPAVRSTAKPKGSRAEIAWHLWQLSVMVDSGISLRLALSCLARQSSRPGLRALFENISEMVEGGCPLSDALAKYPASFPTSVIALIRASELTGGLCEVLHRASTYLMKDVQVVRKMRYALMYPLFMVGLCMTVTLFLLLYVLPRFAQIFSSHSATLPLPTRLLMDAGASLAADWTLWLAGVALAGAATWTWFRSQTGRRQLDYLAITVPGIAPLVNMYCQTRMFRTLEILLETRAPLLDSIHIARDVVANSHYREMWRAVEEQVIVGEQLAAPLFASSFVEEAVAQMVDNGDRTGKLGMTFGKLADYIEERYEHAIKASMQLLEPLMILLMGFVVGFVALAMLLPLFQAAGVMSR